jgi:hypothetical protein
LITETIDRLINLKSIEESFFFDGQQIRGILGTELNRYFHNARLYPALLVIYASGIAAVRKDHFNSLSAILEKPRARRFIGAERTWKYVPYFDEVNVWDVLGTVEHWTLDFNLERFGKRVNHYYYPTKIIQAIINGLIPNVIHFNASFDIFEYLFGLSYLNQTGTEPSSLSFPLLSRVWLQTVGFGGSGRMNFPDPIHSYFADIAPKIERSGFFKGDPQQFQRCIRKYSESFGVNPPETGITLPPRGVL